MSQEELEQNIREAIVDGPYHSDIRRVSLFGSYAYGTPTDESDVDLLIEFDPHARIGMFRYAGMHRYFEGRLGKRVDIVTPGALSKYIRKNVLDRAQSVYEKTV